jgi:DUF917 family protein
MKSLANLQDIQDTARGAVFLGAGGGGDPYVGELFLLNQLSAENVARIVPTEDLADDAFVLAIAGVGAPTVLVEHLVSAKTLLRLLNEAQAHYGRCVDAIISAEIGGANSMFPLALGALAGVPVVDGDGIGRAFPHLNMATFGIYGLNATPSVLVDDSGNSVIVHTQSNKVAENIIRNIAVALGAVIYGSFYPMSGRQAKNYAVSGSLSHAQAIGHAIRAARESDSDPVHGLLRALQDPAGARHARLLFDGKITDVVHETRDGWHFGQAKLAQLNSDPMSKDAAPFTIDIQNEYIIARRDGHTVAMVPDLISVLDRESAEPLTAEMLRYGQRVAVVGYSAPPVLRRPESLAVVGPRQFGVPEDFTPLEQLPDFEGPPA